MLTALGAATIAILLVLILFRLTSVLVALVVVPLAMGLAAGFGREIGTYALAGVQGVSGTAAMLGFAVLYFGVMNDGGLFSPLIRTVVRGCRGDPVRLVTGTALVAMLSHLDGSGASTFLIVIPALLPVYDRLGLDRRVLACTVALGAGTMNLMPWGGPMLRAAAALQVEVGLLFPSPAAVARARPAGCARGRRLDGPLRTAAARRRRSAPADRGACSRAGHRPARNRAAAARLQRPADRGDARGPGVRAAAAARGFHLRVRRGAAGQPSAPRGADRAARAARQPRDVDGGSDPGGRGLRRRPARVRHARRDGAEPSRGAAVRRGDPSASDDGRDGNAAQPAVRSRLVLFRRAAGDRRSLRCGWRAGGGGGSSGAAGPDDDGVSRQPADAGDVSC